MNGDPTMSTTALNDPPLPPRLAAAVAAARADQPGAAGIDAAQQRLQARLANRPRRRASAWGRLLAVAGTACAVLALSLLTLVGGGNGEAFATVQRHFADFDTLVMRIDQRSAGAPAQRLEVAMTQGGDVRVDVADQLSVVFDAAAGMSLTLLHEPRQALLIPMPALSEGLLGDDNPMAWIEEIRQFQGQAMRQPDPQVIDGQTAWAWVLEIEGTRCLLWATADGLPLQLTVDSDGGATGVVQLVDIAFDFRFDPALRPDLFGTQVPPGYELLPGGTEAD
jgi:AcrR family transcriptional regulator